MIKDPSSCPHDSTFRRGDGKTLCLKCMHCLEDLKKNDTVHIAVQEDIDTKEVLT